MKYYTALIADINHPVLDSLVEGKKEGKLLVETAKTFGYKYVIAAGVFAYNFSLTHALYLPLPGLSCSTIL